MLSRNRMDMMQTHRWPMKSLLTNSWNRVGTERNRAVHGDDSCHFMQLTIQKPETQHLGEWLFQNRI